MTTTRIQMLARLNDIMQKRIELAHELAPFYQAARVLAKEDEVHYEMLEENPKFRPLWLQDQDLKNEWLRIVLALA